MEINYQFKNGNEYAKVPGTSYRDNGKVRKKGVIYLGRVIDKEHHIFCNRERGIFSYDPDTGVFGKADETYISDLKSDGRKKQKILLDFGDSFFLDALIKSLGYDTVTLVPDTISKIERLLIKDNDCIKCCLLCQASNVHFIHF